VTSPPSSQSALDSWLASARDALAKAAGLTPAEFDLDHAAVDALLDLARVAAHESGDRRNAPLLCYLVGKAERGTDLESLANAIRRIA
jgi:Domain of unknown function (DUF6457)